MSVLSEIAGVIVSLGQGTLGTDLFIGSQPETPDACIVVLDRGGIPSDLGFGYSGIQHEYPSVQVLVRGEPEDYEAPRAIAEIIYQGLAEIQATTLSGTLYFLIRPTQPPFDIGTDANQRHQIAVNVDCWKELS